MNILKTYGFEEILDEKLEEIREMIRGYFGSMHIDHLDDVFEEEGYRIPSKTVREYKSCIDELSEEIMERVIKNSQ
jgi:hypothetical protein